MKRISMLLIAGLLVACNSKSKVSDQETVADNEEQAAEEVVEAGISDEVKNFTSPDLALNMLHSKIDYVLTTTYSAEKTGDEWTQGAVISIDSLKFDSEGRMIYKSNTNKDERTWYESEVGTYTYTADGVLKSATVVRSRDMKYNLKVKRNADGYITMISYNRGSDESNFQVKYKWENGVLKSYDTTYSESSDGSSYKYDENGFVSEEQFVYGYSEGGTTCNYKYIYTAQDECGNWTKCSVSEECVDSHVEFNIDDLTETTTKDAPIFRYYIKERQIVYQM
jgi:hypothetical protein